MQTLFEPVPSRRLARAGLTALALWALAGAAAAEDRLRAVMAFPPQLAFSQSSSTTWPP